MPIALSHPGVYIQEVPSGTRTITGVSTSLTAFVGPARRGPINRPSRVASFAEFERRFGGLWRDSTMSYAVRHYFLNGGREALIVRVVNGDEATADAAATTATASLSLISDRLGLIAASEAARLPGFDHLEIAVAHGASATELTLTVTAQDKDDAPLDDDGTPASYAIPLDLALGEAAVRSAFDAAVPAGRTRLVDLAGAVPSTRPDAVTVTTQRDGAIHHASLGVAATGALTLEAANPGAWGSRLRVRVHHLDADPGAFHLTIREVDARGATVDEEVFHNVTLGSGDPRALDRVLEIESRLARVDGDMPASGYAASTSAFASFSPSADGHAPRITEDVIGSQSQKTGLWALLDADVINLLCVPLPSWSISSATDTSVWDAAIQLCERKRAFLLIDPPSEWAQPDTAETGAGGLTLRSDHAALYYPRVRAPDPLQEGRLVDLPPCGAVAGVMARTDGSRGIWKSPAGLECGLRGVGELNVALTDSQQGTLNVAGINCLRTFPDAGNVVWGARTLRGADALASEWKYLAVRRLALHLQQTLERGTRWAVFEPNDEPLWSQLRLSIGAYLQLLFRRGAFQGRSAREAYFVRCDKETTTPDDQARGVVNVLVGFAPLRPAEFVVIRLQQILQVTGQ